MQSNEAMEAQKRQKAVLDLAFGLICLVMGCIAYYASSQIPTSVFERVGAGFFAKLVSSCMAVLGLWLTIASVRHVDAKAIRTLSVDIKGNLPVIVEHVLFAVLAATLEAIGFRIGALAFVALSVWVLGGFGRKELLQGIVVGGIITLAVYYGLKELLRLMLP